MAALAYPLQLALGKLDLPPPETIVVRLTDAVSPKPMAPPKSQAAEPRPAAPQVRERTPQPNRPILAMAPRESNPTPTHTVAPQNSAPTAPESAPTSAPAPLHSPAATATVTAARFNAAYLNNPEPKYPPLSRRLGEEGKVLLKVRVTADGQPSAVDLEKTSSFERLDDAARQAVARWRFVPAKRGDEAIEATVIVPIVFRLDS